MRCFRVTADRAGLLRWSNRASLALAILTTCFISPVQSAAPSGPLEPQKALESLRTDEGLSISLAAHEPDVVDPVFVAFDARGRMWVVQMADYPNGPKEGQPGTSSIRVLTDEDGDGRYEKPVVFADGLLFANTLMFWQDGVLVTTDGRLDFLADRDGDGRADFRETWFEGFSRENPQLRANSPTLGHDGLIYVANGLRGGKIIARRPEWGEREPVDISGRDFCFNPLTGEARATTGLGQYGMSFDDYGRRFLCSNRNPCIQTVIPEWALQKNREVQVTAVVADAAVSGEASRIYPVSRFWTTSNLHAGQFTAACGVHIYRGNGLAGDYYSNALTCDPTGNLVHRELLTGDAVVFKGVSPYDKREFVSTEDTWFRPVHISTGPDGSLYVADMYRAVIEHPKFMPDELKTRPDLELGKDRGRIYQFRSRRDGKEPFVAPPLADFPSQTLVELLNHPNVWQRETAFRLLVERQDRSVLGDLTWVAKQGATPQGQTLALWALQRLGGLTTEVLKAASQSTDENVLEQCLLLTVGSMGDSQPPLGQQEEVAKALVNHAKVIAAGQRTASARLRFNLALVLGPEPDALAGLLALDPSDQWLATAVLLSSQDKVSDMSNELISRSLQKPDFLTDGFVSTLGRVLEVIGGRRKPEELAAAMKGIDQVARTAGDAGLSVRSQLWLKLAAGIRSRGGQPLTVLPEVAATAGVDFTGQLEQAIQVAGDSAQDSATRVNALAMLEFASFVQSSDVLTAALGDKNAQVATTAVTTFSRISHPGVFTRLVQDYESRPPAIRRQILTAMFRNETGIKVLLDEIDADRIAATELDPTRMQQLARVKTPELKERADKLIAANKPADRTAVIEQYQPALARKGDPARGRELFSKNCAACHRIGDLGVNVAPDISDSRVKLPSQLLVDILDPNRAIDNNYFNYVIVDTDGQVHNGVIATETSTSITLKQPENKQITLSRDSIEQIRSTGQSLMPVGLEKSLSVEDMSDLISFIKNWRYLDGGVPAEVIR